MTMPFYVAPEQQMKDRADYARKGIARGRSVIVLHYADGILFVAENRSAALHKVSEIYDRIGFAAVGRYNEFERLRTAGIQYADLRGYSYDRTDVTGRGLANAYAQLLGTIFSSGGEKPYEVEIVVAELGITAEQDQIYRLTYDGSVADENNFAVMGGSADVITEAVGRGYRPGLSLADAIGLAVTRPGLGRGTGGRPSGAGCRGARGGHPGPDSRPAAQVPPDHRWAAGRTAGRAGRRAGGRGRHSDAGSSQVNSVQPPGCRDHRRRVDRRVHRLRADRSRLSGAPARPQTEPCAGRGRPGRRHHRAARCPPRSGW